MLVYLLLNKYLLSGCSITLNLLILIFYDASAI